MAISWTIVIFVLCFLPSTELPRVSIPFVDKWVHVLLFAIFTFLWLLAFPGRQLWRLVMVLCSGCLIGLLVEIIQEMLPTLGRSFDSMDILADAAGAGLGVLLFALIARWSEYQNKKGA